MTTIMRTQVGSDNERRCDATCHNAKKPKCSCICGGRYHGKGDQAQEELTKEWLGDDWRDQKAEIEARGGSFEAVVAGALGNPARQTTLKGVP